MPDLPMVENATDPLRRTTPRPRSGRRVYCVDDPIAVGRVAGARRGAGGGEDLQVFTGWWHRIVRRVPLESVELGADGRVQLSMARPEFLGLVHYLPDQEVVERVWDSFRAFRPFRNPGTASIAVTCSDGAVTLSGHVAHEGHRMHAVRCARAVDGVVSLSDRLVSDEHLTCSVARSFLPCPDLQPSLVRVSARLGRVTLEGEVPSERHIDLASSLAWSVAGVAALENRLHCRR